MASPPTGFRFKARRVSVPGVLAGAIDLLFGQSASLTALGDDVTTGGMLWDAVTGATEIRVYTGTSVGSLTLNTTLAGNATGIDWADLDTLMSLDTTYYVQVRSYDGTNESTAWGTTVWFNGSQVG